jgi:hypothetical protein
MDLFYASLKAKGIISREDLVNFFDPTVDVSEDPVPKLMLESSTVRLSPPRSLHKLCTDLVF